MKFAESYLRTRDIDWFFIVNNHYIHVASNGGFIPNFVNDVSRLREEQARVSQLPINQDSDFVINSEYVDSRLSRVMENLGNRIKDFINIEELHNSYLSSFIEMAKKGFYSYDRALEDNKKFTLICYPKKQFIVDIKLLEMNKKEIEISEDYMQLYIKTMI